MEEVIKEQLLEDLKQLEEEEIEKCISAMQKFLSQEYTNDSGKWILKSLHRDKGYIHDHDIHASANIRGRQIAGVDALHAAYALI